MDFELRKWNKSDTENFFKYSQNPKVVENMRDAFPSTLEDCRKTVESFSSNEETQQFCRAIVVNGEAVGCIAIFSKNDVYCKSAEIAYWLGEPLWGRGIMSRAIKELCKTAFEQYDTVRIFAEPYAHNIGSRKALEKAGFVLEGTMKKSVYKNGRLFDSCMYALVK
ncbi:Ribosomal-protein-L7p-serine acetyltransferase [Methanosarcina siciliae C2J]|uniref:Ribosomal-protein-L7p-serine acetyltransferase n=2 Tax=Methanosarcina siciliae TaxID=38027 RepID=A0A0E3P4J6_9EURY|nr:GNAT family protein [Methanosarcina siciliae]AKB28449.1 Ribosomal-protein-L7p-serine acetyltransferase [Methanosarcina siciliae T4/M]AKB36689.1 Ribosomal-protein-L7p-serine acetyltransferase [Methanosarcina siciliae C2J]